MRSPVPRATHLVSSHTPFDLRHWCPCLHKIKFSSSRPGASFLYSLSCREGFFSETCFVRSRTHTVPGRMVAALAARLFTGLPRRVLLGNWCCFLASCSCI